MGIPKFFQWYRNHFPKIVKTYPIHKPLPIDFDTFAIDLNGSFHPIAQLTWGYGEILPEDSYITKDAKLRGRPLTWKEQKLLFFHNVCEEIKRLTEFVHPSTYLILCIDGVAGCAKQAQQRQRRFRSVMDRKEMCRPDVFSSNHLSTGTELMYELGQYIQRYLIQEIENPHSPFHSLRIIYSTEQCPSEGEHKCFHALRYRLRKGEDLSNVNVVIHGLDGDFFMLSTALFQEIPNIFMLRENFRDMNTQTDPRVIVVNVKKLNTLLFQHILEKDKNQRSQKLLPYDQIVLGFFLGNDFLPRIPVIDIDHDGIQEIQNAYIDAGCNLSIRKKDGMGVIDPQGLIQLFSILATRERDILNKQTSTVNNVEAPLLDSCLLPDGKEFDFEKFRDRYYIEKLHFDKDPEIRQDEIDQLCDDYLTGMEWNLRYYTHRIPDWLYCYPRHYAPFFIDLYNYIERWERPRFVQHQPYSPFQQLISILPKEDFGLVPAHLRDVFDESRMEFYYPDPKDIQLDGEGAKFDWQMLVIIPLLPTKVISRVYRRREKEMQNYTQKNPTFKKSKLYIEESKRNTVERSSLLFYSIKKEKCIRRQIDLLVD